jgi:hypothetical protein
VMGVPRRAVNDRNVTSSVMIEARHECNSLFFLKCRERARMIYGYRCSELRSVALCPCKIRFERECKRFPLTGQRYRHTLSAGRVGG